MSQFTEFIGDPRSPESQYMEDDSNSVDPEQEYLDQESAHGSPETPEWDKTGQNGTEYRNFSPSSPDSSEFQVQNPASSAPEWENMGTNGDPREEFCPISPTSSGPQESDPEPSADENDTELTYPELLRGILEFLGSGESAPEGEDKKIPPLTARQLSALPYLAGFPNANQAARASGIGRSTLYRWLEDDHFREELIRRRQESADFAHQELKGLLLRAVDVFRDAMNSGDMYVRLRAARYSMSYSTQVELAEKLRQDLSHLETAVEEWKSKRPLP